MISTRPMRLNLCSSDGTIRKEKDVFYGSVAKVVRCKPVIGRGILPPPYGRLSEDETPKKESEAKDGEKPIPF